MNAYVVKVLKAQYITHDVKCFQVEKPVGYYFIPGQATDVSINLPEWKDQLRPFTFTCLKDQDYLEFMIKIYKDHDGVTNKLGNMEAGDTLILHEVFGAIQYNGTGIFIAGGAGITPFVSIFRDLYKNNQIEGNKLFYSNKTSSDVIAESELEKMLKKSFVKLFTRESGLGYLKRRIDRNFLRENITNFGQKFYLCGPDEFVKNISDYLLELGATAETVVLEK